MKYTVIACAQGRHEETCYLVTRHVEADTPDEAAEAATKTLLPDFPKKAEVVFEGHLENKLKDDFWLT
jgi:hypothetical protein